MRLLCEYNLTLLKTDEICRAAESMMAQMKVFRDISELSESIVKSDHEHQKSYTDKDKSISDRINIRECWHSVCQHEYLCLPSTWRDLQQV